MVLHNEDLIAFQKDIIRGSINAVNDTINSNSTGHILTGAALCGLCLNMIKHNVVLFEVFIWESQFPNPYEILHEIQIKD